MTQTATRSEVWLRGPIPGVEPLLMPIAHTLLQAGEDIQALAATVSPGDAWKRPGGAASIGFHVQHLGGSVDRLFTYARGQELSADQKAALAAERAGAEPPLHEVVAVVAATLERALAQLRATRPERLLDPCKVGRAGLPSTVIGLLFHAAEHATRHVGQAITTARILRGSSERADR